MVKYRNKVFGYKFSCFECNVVCYCSWGFLNRDNVEKDGEKDGECFDGDIFE